MFKWSSVFSLKIIFITKFKKIFPIKYSWMGVIFVRVKSREKFLSILIFISLIAKRGFLSLSYLMKKNVSTEKVALLIVWNIKFLSVTVRSVLFSVNYVKQQTNNKKLISLNFLNDKKIVAIRPIGKYKSDIQNKADFLLLYIHLGPILSYQHINILCNMYNYLHMEMHVYLNVINLLVTEWRTDSSSKIIGLT